MYSSDAKELFEIKWVQDFEISVQNDTHVTLWNNLKQENKNEDKNFKKSDTHEKFNNKRNDDQIFVIKSQFNKIVYNK